MTMISCIGGDLLAIDDMSVIRLNYSKHFANIQTVAQLKATLRAGAYAWPGGYELTLVTSDGATLCFECARKEFYQLCYSKRHNLNDGWNVIHCGAFYDSGIVCDHCNKSLDN